MKNILKPFNYTSRVAIKENLDAQNFFNKIDEIKKIHDYFVKKYDSKPSIEYNGHDDEILLRLPTKEDEQVLINDKKLRSLINMSDEDMLHQLNTLPGLEYTFKLSDFTSD